MKNANVRMNLRGGTEKNSAENYSGFMKFGIEIRDTTNQSPGVDRAFVLLCAIYPAVYVRCVSILMAICILRLHVP